VTAPDPAPPAGNTVPTPTSGSDASRPWATARVGMVGAGQLARMTQRAAIDLGVRLEVLALRTDEPAPLAGAAYQLGDPSDLDAMVSLANATDVVTLDHELVPSENLLALEQAGFAVRPSAAAVRFAQDKLHARTELARLGFPVPPFTAVTDADDVAAFAAEHGWPVVLKARAGGYDGRGVELVGDRDAAGQVLATGGDWLVEQRVDIDVEVAVVAARSPSGEHAVYPIVETVQADGICVELVLPARIPETAAAAATDLANRLVDAIGAVGIVAVELFVTTDGEVVVNELAVRPHNSGHATIEGSTTSQFHNHLRAVLDWPLGDTSMRAPVAATVNLLGGPAPTDLGRRLPWALAVPGAHVHLYGKSSRPGRKLGHVTVLGDDADTALAAARTAAARLVGPAEPDAARVADAPLVAHDAGAPGDGVETADGADVAGGTATD
jgi:5-(carboxyamino)imidazole ribonucleotide synthase